MVVVIGADLGGTKLSAVLCDSTGEVLHRVWQAHQAGDYAAVLKVIAEVVQQCRSYADSLGEQVGALGLAVAGWLSRDRSQIVWGANIATAGAHIRNDLQELLQVPVAIENDGNATALAEQRRGAGREARVLALLTLGTGLGGGVIVAGHPLAGAAGMAGELGHVSVDAQGAMCVCGGVGCAELFASGRGMVRRYEQLRTAGSSGAPALIGSTEIVQAALADEPLAAAVVHAAGIALARAVQALLPVLDPDLVLIGGAVGHAAGSLLLPVIRTELARQRPLRAVARPPLVESAALGPEAGALGAAELAIELLAATPIT